MWQFRLDVVVYLGQLCHTLVNFVPIFCELLGDLDKTWLLTFVKYVIVWSLLCEIWVYRVVEGRCVLG